MGSTRDTSVRLKKCTITENSTSNCGGIFAKGEGELILNDSTLTYNKASSNMGSAIYAENKGLRFVMIGADIRYNWAYKQGAVCLKNAVVSMKGLVIIKSNTSREAKNQADLFLTDDSYVANPGLYKGSDIRVSGNQKLIAKEISEYQKRYFTVEDGTAGNEVVFQQEKTVDTPLTASLFGNANAVTAISLAGAGILVMIIAVIIKKRKTVKGGREK